MEQGDEPSGLAGRNQAFFAVEALVFNASWACLIRPAKATSSRIARSLRTLRSRMMFAAWRPSMKRLYVMPAPRQAALRRTIQRERRSPFFFLRAAYAYCHACWTASFA